MAETYNAGVVTAYGAAVRGGYTGTYQQWCADMANLGDNVAEVREKAAQVDQAAQNFTEQTVPAAIQEVESAGTEAESAIDTAKTEAVTAVQTESATQQTAIQQKGAETIASIPSDYTALSGEVDNLKSAVSAVENSIYDKTDVPLYKSASNWALVGDGLSRSYSGASLRKYKVVAGQQLYLKLSLDTTGTAQGVYQFQNNETVPGQGTNTYLVGEPVTNAVDEYVTVPTGATYLIVSCSSSNNTNVVQLAANAWYRTELNAESALLYGKQAKAFGFWNVSVGGIYVDGSSVKTNANGFSVRWNEALYYIAPTDHTSSYEFTSGSANVCLVIDSTKLVSPGARNEPNIVLSVKTVYNIGEDDIVMAYRRSTSDQFEFIGNFSIFNQYGSKMALIGSNIAKMPISTAFQNNNIIKHMTNTASDLTTAIQNNFKIIECDVRFTADTIPVAVLSHDPSFTVDGTTYTIANETYETLVAAKPTLAKLEDHLRTCKTSGIAVEIDHTKQTGATVDGILAELIKKTGMAGHVIITCTSSVARSVMSYDAGFIFCISNVTQTSQVDVFMDVIAKSRLCMTSTEYGANLTQELVDYIHGAGAMVKTWSINSPENLETVYGMGVDFAITDNLTP